MSAPVMWRGHQITRNHRKVFDFAAVFIQAGVDAPVGPEVAMGLGMTERTYQRCLDDLVRWGVLDVQEA